MKERTKDRLWGHAVWVLPLSWLVVGGSSLYLMESDSTAVATAARSISALLSFPGNIVVALGEFMFGGHPPRVAFHYGVGLNVFLLSAIAFMVSGLSWESRRSVERSASEPSRGTRSAAVKATRRRAPRRVEPRWPHSRRVPRRRSRRISPALSTPSLGNGE